MNESHFTDKTGCPVMILDVASRHLDGIEAIERACFSMPWTREQLAHQMTGEHSLFLCAADETGGPAPAESARPCCHLFLCAEDGTGVLGYVGLMTVMDEGYISNIAVAPEARRRGIADALLDALAARTNGTLAFLTLEVRASNAPAIALYEKHGFSVAGRRKNYYEQPREDALLMTHFFEKEENPC